MVTFYGTFSGQVKIHSIRFSKLLLAVSLTRRIEKRDEMRRM